MGGAEFTCVLAGGASRRFGSDKAFADAGGIPRTVAVSRLLGRRSAGSSGGQVFAVAREAGAFDAWGLASIEDPPAFRGAGPLAGLLAGLRHREAEGGPGWLRVTACDAVEIDPAWFDLLPEPAVAEASVFREGGFFQPLPGRYHTRLIPAVEAALSGGRASFQWLLGEAEVVTVKPPPGLAEAAAAGNRP